jgi:DNA-3-methyladenine glycosylase II
MSVPGYWPEAILYLSKRDPVMKKIIRAYAGESLTSRGDVFFTIARSIAGQQISVKAADSVWKRVEAALPGIAPKHFLSKSVAELRACGLSQRKAEYLHHLSEFFLKEKKRIKTWDALDDETLIKELIHLRGIGRWTAEMMLIFHFMRADVFPVDDIGVLKGIEKNYPVKQPVSKAEATALAEQWRPWRTVATWYLWRSLDPVPVEY